MILTLEYFVAAAPHNAAHPGHWPHEIINHSIRIRMIDIEAIELAISRQINPA
jgi:hypothetical protein